MARPTWDDLRERERQAFELGRTAAQIAEKERSLSPLGRMHLRHGKGPKGARCGDCVHLRRIESANHAVRPFKCLKYRVSNSAATDWRLKWEACGLYEARKAKEIGNG